MPKGLVNYPRAMRVAIRSIICFHALLTCGCQQTHKPIGSDVEPTTRPYAALTEIDTATRVRYRTVYVQGAELHYLRGFFPEAGMPHKFFMGGKGDTPGPADIVFREADGRRVHITTAYDMSDWRDGGGEFALDPAFKPYFFSLMGVPVPPSLAAERK